MSSAEQRYYRACIANKAPYFGRIMRASQGSPIRHAYMQALIAFECRTRAGKPYHILEIGSWAGGSAITWADAIRKYNNGKGAVTCIDAWQLYFKPELCSDFQDVDQYHEMAEALSDGRIYQLFTHNVSASGNSDLVKPIRGFSYEILPSLEEESFDLIFVDGAHDYENVKKDLINLERLVRNTGIVCGDDLELQISQAEIGHARANGHRDYICDPQTQVWFHPGVSLAVGEYFGEVSSWEGFWAMRRCGGTWERLAPESLQKDTIQVPAHLIHQCSAHASPRLLELEYHNYNIIALGHTYYAIACSLGHVHLTETPEEQLRKFHKDHKCLIGSSIDEAKWMVDRLGEDSHPVANDLESCKDAGTPGKGLVQPGEEFLSFNGGKEDRTFLQPLINYLTESSTRPALAGLNRLTIYMLNLFPELKDKLACIVDGEKSLIARDLDGLPIVNPGGVPTGVDTIFLCETRRYLAQQMKQALPKTVNTVSLPEFTEKMHTVPRKSVPIMEKIDTHSSNDTELGARIMTEEDQNTLFKLAAGEPLDVCDRADLQPPDHHRKASARSVTGELARVPAANNAISMTPLGTYKGFNIIILESRYFALPQDCRVEGTEDLKKNTQFVGHDLHQVKTEIDKLCSKKAVLTGASTWRQNGLLVCNMPAENLSRYLEMLKDYELTLFNFRDEYSPLSPLPVIHFPNDASKQQRTIEDLKKRKFDVVIIPYEGKDYREGSALERFASSFTNRVMTILPDGRTRIYSGEDLHRIMYNKDYLASMFKHVVDLKGKRVLEVGCSDGLACDLLLSEEPEHVTGIDVLDCTGCSYDDPRLNFATMDASGLLFEDDSYDVSYSIATLEHSNNPLASLEEMKRVTRPGGLVYVQAGPLYYSPFGHHMFGYFDHYPWIHLRLSKEEIISYSKETGIARKVEANLGRRIEHYVDGMLNIEHVNGRRISEYGLEEFMESPEIEVLSFNRTYEGENLLNESILKELSHIDREDLVAHGFELIFRVLEKKPRAQKRALGISAAASPIPAFRFSFLLPTRGNPDLVARLFRSIMDTTSSLKELEIIMGIDDDDLATQQITHDRLNLKKVIVPRGQPMGALVQKCFEASSGRFVMGVNDDLILRTKGWDDVIASRFDVFGDDIGLIHVNDLLFKETLCTFPVLSRRACLEIGYSPLEYKRYKIDDHIYDTYNLLAFMGYKRITYLPDVVFEHENHGQVEDTKGAQHYFKSNENKFYVPDQKIIKRDDEIFKRKFQDRKEAALKLAAIIEEDRRQRISEARRKAQRNLLRGTADSYSYRRKDFVATYPHLDISAKPSPRATIAVITADIRSDYASRCISLVKQHTSDFDLIVLDNGRDKGFSHPKEMNKVMKSIDTDLLVLLDDDVFVEPGWLGGLIRCVDEKTAVVAPMHKDRYGKISFTGSYLAGDGQGIHEHTFDVPFAARSTQICCSAAILLDMKKCGQIFMEEAYKKYFFDIVHCLEVWEAGYRVVVTPEVTVTHIGGATAVRGTDQCNRLFEADRRIFIDQWIKTSRLARLDQKVWQKDPYLRMLAEIPRQIGQLEADLPSLGLDDFNHRVAQVLFASFKAVPHDDNFFVQRILNVVNSYINVTAVKGEYDRAKSCLPLLLGLIRDKCNGSGLDLAKIFRDLEDLHRRMGPAVECFARVQTLKNLAVSRYTQGDKAGAEQTFLKALQQAPRDSDILVSLGRICYESQRYKEAMKYNEAALSINGRDAEAWVGLALIARDLKSPDAMRAACEQLRTLNPQHPMFRELMLELG